jgi:hypothetical protein
MTGKQQRDVQFRLMSSGDGRWLLGIAHPLKPDRGIADTDGPPQQHTPH